jgi:uncharacterized OB-fold protein
MSSRLVITRCPVCGVRYQARYFNALCRQCRREERRQEKLNRMPKHGIVRTDYLR